MYTYRVVCQKLSAPELGPYTTYGILAARDRRGCQQAAQFISAGKAAIDGLPCEKPDKTVTEGAKISVRGLGKIKLQTVGGQTKKGRISVIIHRYM